MTQTLMADEWMAMTMATTIATIMEMGKATCGSW